MKIYSDSARQLLEAKLGEEGGKPDTGTSRIEACCGSESCEVASIGPCIKDGHGVPDSHSRYAPATYDYQSHIPNIHTHSGAYRAALKNSDRQPSSVLA